MGRGVVAQIKWRNKRGSVRLYGLRLDRGFSLALLWRQMAEIGSTHWYFEKGVEMMTMMMMAMEKLVQAGQP